jgi:hypothetical protein
VRYTVTFSEDVVNVDPADFALTVANVTGASVNAVIPISGSDYTVWVGTGSGNGTIRLDVPMTATINDLAGNPLPATGFTAGQSYTLNRTTSSPVLPPAPEPPPSPLFVSLVPTRSGAGRPTKLVLRIPLSTGGFREIVSPFQKPKFTNIVVALQDSNGDGLFDSVLITARQGKKKVSRTIVF